VAARGTPRLARHAFALVCSSPAKRSQETARLAGFPDPVVVDDLRERDYGKFEGLTTAEIRARGPEWREWNPRTGPLQLIVNRALELSGAGQAILPVPRESDRLAGQCVEGDHRTDIEVEHFPDRFAALAQLDRDLQRHVEDEVERAIGLTGCRQCALVETGQLDRAHGDRRSPLRSGT